jgi:carboxylesterase type B
MFLTLLILIHCFHRITSNDLHVNTTSGRYEGKETLVNYVRIRQFFGIHYAERPARFELPQPRRYPDDQLRSAKQRAAACLQTNGGLSYGPFELTDMYNEDCLTLDIFIPKSKSNAPKAIMVFCHGGSNQVGSASLFDGSVIAGIGDVIVISVNYRLNILGFLSGGPERLPGNYGLHDQLLALKWISTNAKALNGDAKRITYVGHSAGAANAVLLAMSHRSDGLIARVIAQSGCPLNRW